MKRHVAWRSSHPLQEEASSSQVSHPKFVLVLLALIRLAEQVTYKRNYKKYSRFVCDMACDQRASTKVPGRSRWNANQQQLQTLEGMFEQGNGNTPNKARIKEIALELSQYGQISETNVYNWFQNRKARAKRKLQHQVGRRRRLTRSTAENVPKVLMVLTDMSPHELYPPKANHPKPWFDLRVKACIPPHDLNLINKYLMEK